jgi:DNA-binding NarL/FixJ family response regulator
VVRVFIIAPYAFLRAGLHALTADAGDLAVVGEAGGSEELERLLPGAPTDVLLVEYGDADGPRLLEVAAAAGSAVVLLGERAGWTGGAAAALTRRSLPAWAFLLKEASGAEIAAAIRATAAGLLVLDRRLGPWPGQPEAPDAGTALSAGPSLRPDFLTAREQEVFQLIAQGLPNKGIAARLGISQHTVKFHVASVLAKLGAASRTEAVTLGARRGLLIL